MDANHRTNWASGTLAKLFAKGASAHPGNGKYGLFSECTTPNRMMSRCLICANFYPQSYLLMRHDMRKWTILIWFSTLSAGVSPALNARAVEIQDAQSGRCLDADTATIGSNGTKVQLWDCWGGQNQNWQVTADGTIVNLQSHRCLDADTASMGSNGTKIQLWDCWGGQNQRWHLNLVPGRNTNITNSQSLRCLDADTATIGANGTKVQLWDCWGGQNQNWQCPDCIE
jgi:hypothetical protein